MGMAPRGATVAAAGGTAEAAKRPVFPGHEVGSEVPCEVGAAENGRGAHFEDRGGGVCWVNLP